MSTRHAWFLLVAAVVAMAPVWPDSARATPPVVVIDPGHGGGNAGAKGPRGLIEKRLNLRAAKLLEQALAPLTGVRVVLTRRTDRYLTLSQRVRAANRAGGALFVSLHCNASPKRNQRGYEVFVLAPDGLDRQAAPGHPLDSRLTGESAARGAVKAELVSLLRDLRRRGQRRLGVALGRRVIAQLESSLGANLSRGLREAQLDVLVGLRMPAVLVEMGFIDHPVEGRRLASRAYLQRVVNALARAIRRFLSAPQGHTARRGVTRDRRMRRRRPSRHRRPAPWSPVEESEPSRPAVAAGAG